MILQEVNDFVHSEIVDVLRSSSLLREINQQLVSSSCLVSEEDLRSSFSRNRMSSHEGTEARVVVVPEFCSGIEWTVASFHTEQQK